MRSLDNYSKVGRRKKAKSSRWGSKPSIEDKRIKSLTEITFVEKFRNSSGQLETRKVTRRKGNTSANQYQGTAHYNAQGTLKRDTSNSFRIFTPSNKDFRPVLWRYAKPYTRYEEKVIGLEPLVHNVYPSRSGATVSNVTIEGKYPVANLYVDVYKGVRSADMNLHYLNFNKKLGDQKVDVLTTLAEAKSTVTMVAGAAENLFKFYRAVRKADLKTIKHLLAKKNIKRKVSKGWRNKAVESRWLELQYGWQPFAADIRTAMEELTKDNRPSPPIIKVMHSTLIKPDNYVGNIYVDYNHFGILKTVCYYSVESKGIRDAAKWNLASNPLLTGWELVPYSFVVDWFIPIGDFLQQFSSSNGLEFVDGSTVYYMKFKGTSAWTTYDYNLKADITFRDYHEMYYINRKTHSISPIGFPVFTLGLSVGRALNALALISQRR